MAASPKVQFKRIIRMYAFILAAIIVLSVASIYYTMQLPEQVQQPPFQQMLWVVSLLFLLVIPGGLTVYKRQIIQVNFGDPLSKKLRLFRRGFYGQLMLLLLGALANMAIMVVTHRLIIALQIALIAGAATISFPALPRMQSDLKLGQNDMNELQN